MTRESNYVVKGLNCGGCVGTLTRKAMGIYGVVHVDVELHPGQQSRVVVRHVDTIAPERIATALVEAGYVVAAPAVN